MSTSIEKDALTGKTTTGHEWDGIKELNTPLPKWWLYVLYATIAWSAVWWLLYPSWPWVTDYFGGIIGANQRLELVERMAVAETAQAQYLERIGSASLDQIAQDPELANFALVGGGAAFADNCAPCHGLGGAGQGFYPNLADDAWIWGGTLTPSTPRSFTASAAVTRRPGSTDARVRRARHAHPGRNRRRRARALALRPHRGPDAAARGAALFAEQRRPLPRRAGRGNARVWRPGTE